MLNSKRNYSLLSHFDLCLSFRSILHAPQADEFIQSRIRIPTIASEMVYHYVDISAVRNGTR